MDEPRTDPDHDAGAGEHGAAEQDAAEAFEQLWAGAPELDEATLWSRIAADVASTPQVGPAWWDPRGWAARSPWRPVPTMATAVGAAAGLALVTAAVLATQGGNSEAAVLEDVESLFEVTALALADEMLSESERSDIQARADALVLLIERDPRALEALDDEDIARVIALLDSLIATVDVHYEDDDEALELIGSVSERAHEEQDDRAGRDLDDRDGDDGDADDHDADDLDEDDADEDDADDRDDRDDRQDEDDAADEPDHDDRDDLDDRDDDQDGLDGDGDEADDERDDSDAADKSDNSGDDDKSEDHDESEDDDSHDDSKDDDESSDDD
jgi:hypothetical protein